MGELKYFLLFQAKQSSDVIFISQRRYVKEMLKKFDICGLESKNHTYEPIEIGYKRRYCCFLSMKKVERYDQYSFVSYYISSIYHVFHMLMCMISSLFKIISHESRKMDFRKPYGCSKIRIMLS